MTPTISIPETPSRSTGKLFHIQNFDILRLLFSSMVVLFHIALLSQAPALRSFLNISSSFAVQAFFFVSGFLVTMSRENTGSLKRYFSKRVLRIAPAYVGVIVCAAFLLALLSSFQIHDYFIDKGFLDYLKYNLILSNFAAPSLPGVFLENPESAVNGSLWTIKIEVLFYCMVPLIAYACRRFDYRYVLGIIFTASLAWRLGFEVLAVQTGADFYSKLAKQLPGQLAYFGGGMLAYYRMRDGLPAPAWWMAVLAAAAYTASDGLLYWLVAPFSVTLIVYWLAMGKHRFWSPARYGDFSYGLYLYHFPIVQAAVALGYFQNHPGLTTLGVVLTAFGVSVLSWFFVERRFLHRR